VQAKPVADIGDPSKSRYPSTFRFLGCKVAVDQHFMDGTARLFDLTNPDAPKQVYSKKIGAQVNMVSQSWTASGSIHILSSRQLGQEGADNEQFLKGYSWTARS